MDSIFHFILVVYSVGVIGAVAICVIGDFRRGDVGWDDTMMSIVVALMWPTILSYAFVSHLNKMLYKKEG